MLVSRPGGYAEYTCLCRSSKSTRQRHECPKFTEGNRRCKAISNLRATVPQAGKSVHRGSFVFVNHLHCCVALTGKRHEPKPKCGQSHLGERDATYGWRIRRKPLPPPPTCDREDCGGPAPKHCSGSAERVVSARSQSYDDNSCWSSEVQVLRRRRFKQLHGSSTVRRFANQCFLCRLRVDSCGASIRRSRRATGELV